MPNFTLNDITSLNDSMLDNMFKITIVHPLLSEEESKLLSARCTNFEGPEVISPKVKTIQLGQYVRHQVDGLSNSASSNVLTLTFLESAKREVKTILSKLMQGQRNPQTGIMPAGDSSALKFQVVKEDFSTDGETVTSEITYTGCLFDTLPNIRLDRTKSQSGNVTFAVKVYFEGIQ